MKKISIMFAIILCAFSCAACGAPETDSSSVLQDSTASQPDGISTEQGSAAEDLSESLDKANNMAKEIYTALLSYSDKCSSNDVTIPDGELIDLKIDAANEDFVVMPPSGGYAALEDAASDIQKAVSVYMCDHVGTEGTFFSIKIANGFLLCTVWSEKQGSHIVGGYPNFATEADWTLEKAVSQN